MIKAVPAKPKKRGIFFKLRVLPLDTVLDVPAGTTIIEAIQKAGLPIMATCGGKGTCGDCLIQIREGWIDGQSFAALSDELRKQQYALACRTSVHDNLTIFLPKYEPLDIKAVFSSKYFEGHKNAVSGSCEIDSVVRQVSLQLPPPSLDNNSSDLKRLRQEILKKEGIRISSCEYSTMKKLAQTIRKNNGRLVAVLFKSEESWALLDVRAEKGEEKIFGIACDIGTTTVVLHIVDLERGEIVGTASSLNQQITRGEDIISRIDYAQRPARLRELRNLIAVTINHLIEKAAQSCRISPSDIYYASFAGNTTMIHLFLNLDPRYLREEPYVPTFNDVPILSNRTLKLKMNPEARAYFAPAVGSYVGGDITAGLLCTPILRDSPKISLFIDAGTNGELVVGNKEWLMTCACSAGPAFEGGGVKCGMPATLGAIEKIRLNDKGEPDYSVIGGTKPKGLCGSGMVDLLAELFVHGFIDRLGKFTEKTRKTRFFKNETDGGFLIEKPSRGFWGRALLITEKDIANLIRTKAAVFSACSLLLKNVGLPFDKIDALYIAGGFGQHLDVENAIRIGLLPDLGRDRFHYLGNTSLLGAYLILLNGKNRALVEELAEEMTYIELNTESNYMNEYTGALFLPHTQMEYFPSLKKQGGRPVVRN